MIWIIIVFTLNSKLFVSFKKVQHGLYEGDVLYLVL